MNLCTMAVRDGGTLVYEQSLQPTLEAIQRHADEIGKRDHFERMLARLAYPTFFGVEARTIVYNDFAPFSLGFNIQVKQPDGSWRFAMNGGFIYHQSAQEWSIHT